MFSEDMINSFPSYAVRDGMACVPSLQEVRDMLSLIPGDWAGGGSGILPEMVKVCCDELLVYLVQLFSSVWLFHRIGRMHCWYLYLSRVICPCVTIGKESVCWMWW